MKYLLALLILIGGCTTGYVTQDIPAEEHFNYTILFCGECMDKLLHYIDNADEAACALYNADESIIEAIDAKGTLITDSSSKSTATDVIKRNYPGIMHNKFCVFDRSIVWTGSFNPTGTKNTADNVIIINSTLLAANYLQEFEELKTNESSKTATTKIILNNTLIENYFCPEDGCIGILQSKLSAAEESIYFATYSFTHPKIANELIIKHSNGVKVKGIIETGSPYSQFETLKSNNIDVVEDTPKRTLHHKFFVIDEKTVITGSFNPTRNGDERNDENVVVINDERVAIRYLNEFKQIWNELKEQN